MRVFLIILASLLTPILAAVGIFALGFSFTFLWIALAIVVGVFAEHRRGQSEVAWYLAALFVSPLIAGLILLVSSDSRRHACPACAEQIFKTASVCPHCKTPQATPVDAFLAAADRIAPAE